MRKLLITAGLIIGAFILPGFLGTLLGIAGGAAAASFFFTAPKVKRLLSWGADKVVADETRRKKAEDWINTHTE